MPAFAPPAPEYVGPPVFSGDSVNKPINHIVIHGTTGATATRPGYARIIARYFRTTVTTPSSCHYIVDPVEVLQLVWDSIVAYGAPPNRHKIHVELCDSVTGPLSRWDDEPHEKMLRLAARLVAELCLAYDIPIRKVGALGLRLGRRGIVGHVNISRAFGLTSHWDPGKFPWRRFIRMIRAEADELVAEQTATKPTRVTRFRDECEALVTKYLDAAVDSGREGRVKDVRDNIRAELARLPRR